VDQTRHCDCKATRMGSYLAATSSSYKAPKDFLRWLGNSGFFACIHEQGMETHTMVPAAAFLDQDTLAMGGETG